MDNPEILFYIVAALIYFFTKGKKKTKSIPQPREEREGDGAPAEVPPQTPEPVISFEDLLKEMTGQSSKPKSVPPPEPVYEPEPEPELVVVEEPKVIKRDYGMKLKILKSSFEKEEIKKKQEQSTSYVEGDDEEESASNRFDSYKIEEKRSMAAEIKEMLTDPEDVRKAIILQEVLGKRF
jgi:hypothetical protein